MNEAHNDSPQLTMQAEISLEEETNNTRPEVQDNPKDALLDASITSSEESKEEQASTSTPDQTVTTAVPPTSLKERLIIHLKGMRSELWGVLVLCWPTVVMNVCYMVLGLESLSFIGHVRIDKEGEEAKTLSERYMAAASLGNSFFFCFIFIAVGLIHGQDTLVSQSCGAGNFRRMGNVLCRSISTILVSLIPISIILFFSNYSLSLMQQEQELVSLVGIYLRILLPGVLPFALCESISLFLIAQDILMPNIVIWVCSVFINLGLSWLLVFGIGFEGLGFIGAPIATTITRYFMLIAYIVVIYLKGYMKDTWAGFVDFREVFKWAGFKEFLKLALPGALMLAAEIWGFELSTITTSFLGPVYLASHSVILNLAALTFMFPLSLGVSCSIRVGQYLGSLEPIKAKYTAYSSMIFAALFMFLSGLTLALTRNYVPRIYTEDTDILSTAAEVLPLCALFQIFDGLQAIAAGVLRGVGKQAIGATANLVAYYVLGLPLGAVLSFVAKWNLIGIWLGLTFALFSVSVTMTLYIVFRIDWQKESELANKRALEEKAQIESAQEKDLELGTIPPNSTVTSLDNSEVPINETTITADATEVNMEEDLSRFNSRANLLAENNEEE